MTAPTRFDLAKIEAVMLWPDDEAVRARMLNSVLVALAITASNDFTREGLVDLAKHAAVAAPMADIRKDAQERFPQGLYAGKILREAVGYNDINPDRARLGVVMDKATKQFTGRSHTNSKILHNKIWPRYRRVAHFWAAHIHIALEDRSGFPCQLADLLLFLAIAREYQRLGEAIRQPHSPTAVLAAST